MVAGTGLSRYLSETSKKCFSLIFQFHGVTEEGLQTETVVCPIFFLIYVIIALDKTQFDFLFVMAVAVACAGLCGDRKMSPRKPSIVQIMFSFWFLRMF